jgi:hypothetical protein
MDGLIADRLVGALYKVVPSILMVIQIVRWVDAYRLSVDIPLPAPLPIRLVLARYNLLAASTHIYRAYLALKKPTPPAG